MKEEKKLLEEMQEKISATWTLLDVDQMIAQLEVSEKKMQDPNFWQDPESAKKISQQHEELRKEVEIWSTMRGEVSELLLLCEDLEEQPDEEMKKDIGERIQDISKRFSDLEFLLLMDGKHDKNNAIVEFHAGSGGTEAQDWAEMLRRMIVRYTEKKGWTVTMLSESLGTEAGIKSCTMRIEGRYAYGYLQSEHGTHRLVRISPFDSEGMRHTSFANIEVIPEIESEDFEINENDLRIDTFMSSGKGGQSVNTTYSAVRIVHIPTGIMVSCQNEKSQLQNKKVAMKILHSRLQQLQDEKEEEERLKLRGEYKSAEWGNQIRSYVLHPYKMVKDLRSGYETSDPEAFLDGDLDVCIEEYLRFKKAQ